MATKVFPITSSACRAKEADEEPQIMGVSTTLGLGYEKPFDYLFYIKAAIDALEWTDVKKITAARLYLTVPPNSSSIFPFGGTLGSSSFKLGLLSGAFPDNTKTDFTKGDYDKPGYYSSPAPVTKTWAKTVAANSPVSFDVLPYIEAIAPAAVRTHDDKPCKGKTNYGFKLYRVTSSAQPDPRIVVASETYPDNTIQPYIELTYDAKPSVDYTALQEPSGTIVQIEDQFFKGTFVPGSPGEQLYEVHIQVYKSSTPAGDVDDGGTVAVWQQKRRVSGSETSTNQFVTPLPAVLKSAASYKWRARTRSGDGAFTAWPLTMAFTVTTDNPAVSSLSPAGTYKTLNGVSFTAHFSDPNTNKPASYRIQVRERLASSDPTWDDGPFFWDTNDRTTSHAERILKYDRAGHPYYYLSVLYGGTDLLAGDYSFRIKATDTYGADSAWQYGTFTTTQDDLPDPGDDPFLTGYARRRVRNRVVIRSMLDPSGVKYADRRPGGLVAIIEDAANIGASEYHNSGGEFYFTLPATHPQVGVIEPWKVHYALETYRGQGWTEIAAGLITDFDASDDDIIFYGIDYLGILGLLVDDRFNASSADAKAVLWPATGGGAKYVDRTISQIVTDQIDRAIHGTDSPVAFITRGAIAPMTEKVTLFATFKTRLDFISGLLDSHRGTNIGNRTRLRVRKVGTAYQFWVEDNPGQDRPNLRMEYGGLVQGVRVIGFGAFGTRVMAIGQNPNSSKVEYIPNALGVVSEPLYGRIPKVNIWPDISDKNDLTRRAKLLARQVSKVGKRVALGLRVDALGVKDNWDIADSVPLDIERGVIDTERYGSGLYTIVGWAFQVFPDGHTDLTLSLLPKMDAEPPDTDLIPSAPVHDTPEWAIKPGKPVPMTLAEFPTDGSPTTFDVVATKTYVDADTSLVYEYDVDSNLWVETEELLEGPEGPPGADGAPGAPGPAGPPGPAGAAGFMLGQYKWSTTRGAPASGRVTLKANLVVGVANALQLNDLHTNGANRDPYLSQVRSGDTLFVDDKLGNLRRALVSGTPIDHGTWWEFPFVPVNTVEPANNADVDVLLDATSGAIADTVPPPVPVIKAVTSASAQQDDGTPITNLVATVGYAAPPGGLTDLDQFILQSTRFSLVADATQPDWTLATQWVAQTADNTGTADTYIVQPTVLAATQYWVRAFAVDKAGNRQATASNVFIVITDEDDDAPPAPGGIISEAGMSTIGIRWDPIEVPDLAYVEVRWRESAPVGNWSNAQTAGTIIVITGLANDRAYDLQLRSVDTSGNTIQNPAVDPPVTVKATDPEAGWVPAPSVSPTTLPGNALVWNDAMIAQLFAGKINADWVTAGTLKVGGLAGAANAIEVYDASARLIGRWSSSGIEILDATNPRYKLTVAASSMYIYDLVDPANPYAIVSISPLGIDASSITFGSARGGHNLVPNSSFELGQFSATDLRNQTWDVAADWNAANSRQGADINITTGASSLTMTTV